MTQRDTTEKMVKQGFAQFGNYLLLLRLSGAMLLASALPLLLTAPTRATPLPPAPSPNSAGGLPAPEATLTPAPPELPPLGSSDRLLPSPDPATDAYLVISLSDRRVYVYDDQDQVQVSYPVAIGRSGWETPTGEFKVLQMLRQPIWQHPFTGELVPPGADNPLGSRWIAFWTDGTNFIGLHGTPNEESIGQPASHGCVRMYDRDVVKLFEMVQVGTPVIVKP